MIFKVHYDLDIQHLNNKMLSHITYICNLTKIKITTLMS